MTMRFVGKILHDHKEFSHFFDAALPMANFLIRLTLGRPTGTTGDMENSWKMEYFKKKDKIFCIYIRVKRGSDI